MHINVSGRKVDVGEALRSRIIDRMAEIVGKYFDRSIDCQVTVGRERHLFCVDCALHVRHGIHMQSRGLAEDARAAFEAAVDRVEKQLRRYKRRLKDRHLKSRHGQEEEIALLAQAYILAPEEAERGAKENLAFDEGDEQPVIIAETRTEIPYVSVGDAVMLMDLAEMPALMFRNRRNDRFNIVYRRPDGNIGWVDPVEAGCRAKLDKP